MVPLVLVCELLIDKPPARLVVLIRSVRFPLNTADPRAGTKNGVSPGLLRIKLVVPPDSIISRLTLSASEIESSPVTEL